MASIAVRAGVAIALTGLAGCASIRGRPEHIRAADLEQRLCPSDAQMTAFEEMSGAQRGAYRDRVVSQCVGAYNRRYADFTAALSDESISTSLAVDIASGGLTTLAGIAAPRTAKRLSAGAGFALGVGAAVDRNIFYNATLPALLTAMDARRNSVLATIVQSEAQDPDGLAYPLARAAIDLDRYEDAGTLATGFNELNRTAAVAAARAAEEVALAQRGKLSFVAVVLDSSVQPRVKALTRKAAGLPDTPAGRTTLDALASRLGLAPDDADTTDIKRGHVVTAILETVSVPGAADQQSRITRLEADLNPLF